ncbi:hypothetical protein TEA_009209 [Camellia sinensis var. sinensis]|uniref:Protein kinase domain-containing protein n=1 Tax=Camellia sinensis var. sinensis TaxID=542762 RepID=A0A4S4EEN4_CAMSN|nr:hypothetical protein TEA_009209 [Camellia sinensis var. sinensis]
MSKMTKIQLSHMLIVYHSFQMKSMSGSKSSTAGLKQQGSEHGEGLDHDPYNSVLLCNKATCRSKLSQFEKAMKDWTAALNVRPSYRKARLRRVNCYAKVMASKTKIYIVLEYVGEGELFDKIPENLLLDSFGVLKVSDFGLSAFSQQVREDVLFHTAYGTPNYVAPEVLTDKGYDGTAADIWSCGVILFVLMAGYLPFDEPNHMALKAIKNLFFSSATCFHSSIEHNSDYTSDMVFSRYPFKKPLGKVGF